MYVIGFLILFHFFETLWKIFSFFLQKVIVFLKKRIVLIFKNGISMERPFIPLCAFIVPLSVLTFLHCLQPSKNLNVYYGLSNWLRPVFFFNAKRYGPQKINF